MNYREKKEAYMHISNDPFSVKTLRLVYLVSRLRLRRSFALGTLVLASFALSPLARAACGTPDGGCDGNNTAEGDGALSQLENGMANTAIGHNALHHEANGNYNTATGAGALGFDNGAEFNTADGFQALFKNETGFWNTATGAGALHENIGGAFNTATGVNALRDNQTGNHNTATGTGALPNNIDGQQNTANGSGALHENIDGAFNTATGGNALFSNTSGIIEGKAISGRNNTANGSLALYSNQFGSDNTAVGFEALFENIGPTTPASRESGSGSNNSALGSGALHENKYGTQNTAVGFQALYNNIGSIPEPNQPCGPTPERPERPPCPGSRNSALGYQALNGNFNGHDNTAIGASALGGGGDENTAIGASALASNGGNSNTAVGYSALLRITTGAGNIALGHLAGSNLTRNSSNNIDIGNTGVANDDSFIRIGTEGTHEATFIAGIANATVTGPAVFIDTTTDQLGLLSSSERFKDGIEPMGKASEALLSLRPVTFRYKKNIDPKGARQFGLVAEDVEKVNPDLVVRDKNGEIYTVRYEAVNAMLLNEFLKEHRRVEDQVCKLQRQESKAQQREARLAKQDATITQQQKQIEALTAGLQRVSDQVELGKSAPQLVGNRH